MFEDRTVGIHGVHSLLSMMKYLHSADIGNLLAIVWFLDIFDTLRRS